MEAVLNEADIKKDGQIDFEEFCTIMKPIHDKKIEEEATKVRFYPITHVYIYIEYIIYSTF